MASKTNMTFEMIGKNEKLLSALNESNRKLSQFSNQQQKRNKNTIDSFMTIAKVVAVAYAVKKVVEFGKKTLELGGKVEGVTAAFKRLNDRSLLNDLRQATRGTVSDMKLMQTSLDARNFKIPLDQLATYFEFATARAIETGQEVDYLVESIVTGLGRESVLILDNLGISQVDLRKKMKETGDMASALGLIIKESMTDAASTTKTAMEQMTTSWENLRNSVAAWASRKAEGGDGLIGGVMSSTSKKMQLLAEFFGGSGFKPGVVEAQNDIDNFFDSLSKTTTPEQKLEALRKKLSEVNTEVEDLRKKRSIAKISLEQFKPYATKDDLLIEKIVDGLKLFSKGEASKMSGELGKNLKIADENLTIAWETKKAYEEQLKILTEIINKGNEVDPEITGYTRDQIDRMKTLREVQEAIKIIEDLRLDGNKEQIQVYDSQLTSLKAQKAYLEGIWDKDVTFKPTTATLTPISDIIPPVVFDSLENLPEALRSSMKTSVDIISRATQEINSMFEYMIEDSIMGFAEAIGESISGGDLDGIFRGLIGVIANFTSKFGALLIAQGVAVEAFKTSLKSLQGWGAIAAGAALIAISSAIRSAASKGPQGYALGGIVPGSSYTGDKVPAMVNSGEMILNRRQQNNMFNMLNNGGDGFVGELRADGTELIAVINNTNKRNVYMR